MSHVNYCQSIATSRKPIAKAGLSAESALSFSSRSTFFSNSSAFSAMPVTNLPQIQDSVQATSTVPARWKVCAVQSVPNLLGITNRPPKKSPFMGHPCFDHGTISTFGNHTATSPFSLHQVAALPSFGFQALPVSLLSKADLK